MEYIPIGIAEVIEASAEAHGISLLQLSKKSGISYSGVLRKVKHRSRRINVDDLCAFAAALEVQPSELVRQAESRANTVFPAHAGMSRRAILLSDAKRSFPRSRGDELYSTIVIRYA